MDLKFLTFCLLSGVCLNLALAAPKPSASPEYLLEKNLAEYLRHDNEMMEELEEIGILAHETNPLPRFKRQVEFDNSPDLEEEGGEGAEDQPGFFDRAAKFIVDLLQRFLKWINTDSN